jgi:nifR3 family TIM-barrel protein
VKKRMRNVVGERGGPGPLPPGGAAGDWPLATPFRIGDVEIPNRVVQAPLAGIANRAFRAQATRHGAGLCVSEMVAALGLHHGNARTAEMLERDAREGVTGIQLFGARPDAMAEAARAVEAAGADLVDVNMGCPVKKVCRTGAGAALLADLDLAAGVVRAMVAAVDIPVTVKMRSGLTPAEARPAEAARRFEDAGAAAISFHPRAAAEEYRGTADHALTAEVVRAVGIPVVASGDITTARGAAEVLEDTGCAAVMIGRGALGDPWLYGAVASGRGTGRPDLPGVVEEVARFAGDVRDVLGDHRATHYMRKFYPWYLAGEPVPNAAVSRLLVIDDLDEALGALRAAARAALATTPGLN